MSEQQSPEANFSTLLLSIAHSAKIGLGVAPHPENKETEKNLSLARYNIDLLVLLRHKTQNNLLEDEQKLLDAMISDLQMNYLQVK